jgi:hypothetical protein
MNIWTYTHTSAHERLEASEPFHGTELVGPEQNRACKKFTDMEVVGTFRVDTSDGCDGRALTEPRDGMDYVY